jgi:membrane-bound serine protease (ClpP class)
MAMGAATGAPRSTVVGLKIDGVVDPFIASYVEAGVKAATSDGAAAVLITIDTPGGLDSSMRSIIKAVLGSRVPVLCLTAPSGARAASAGTFIMMGCPVAAMAPGTNIGAAHPVGVSGAIEQSKVTNDAAAFIRSLAEKWGRNADWAEQSVRNSVAIPAQEALSLHVIDLIASTPASLVDAVGNCSGAPPETISTGLLRDHPPIAALCGAEVAERRLGLGPGILHALIDPNVAFLFFYLGLAMIVIELLHPGITIPGILGTVLLVSAFMSFGFLAVQLGGVILLIASGLFFLLELKHPGLGLPTVGGVITLVLGGLFLFNPAVPNGQVSLWLLGAVAGLLVLFFGFVVKVVKQARDLPPAATGIHDLVRKYGVAVTRLAPGGHVRVQRETWSAVSPGSDIEAGTAVRVIGVEGLRLIVEPKSSVEGDPAARGAAGTKGGAR